VLRTDIGLYIKFAYALLEKRLVKTLARFCYVMNSSSESLWLLAHCSL